MEKQRSSVRYAPEVRERAGRMVLEQAGDPTSQWEAIGSIAVKIGGSGETLRKWVQRGGGTHGAASGASFLVLEHVLGVESEPFRFRGDEYGGSCLRAVAMLDRIAAEDKSSD
jgi:transposase